MSPFEITGWMLIIVILTMLVAYFVPRRKKAHYLGDVDMKIEPRLITPEARLVFPTLKRPVGKHPALAAPYHPQFGKRVVPPTKKPTVAITPRQMESVNIKRKLRGYPPLNRAGVKNAISSAWDTPYKEPATTNDWLLYLILWETFSDDHKANTCAGTGGFTIDPNLPYNGHGGEFAGAGASGSWTDAPPDVQSAASGIATGASAAYMEQHFVTDNPGLPSDEFDAKYTPGDHVGGYSAPDPSTVREPDPSPVSDSSSSYSSSSSSDSSSSSSSSDSSSSSSSSDSGSSGGGDSGGGGGGD